MISFLVFLLVLGVLIMVHEFGHFIAAKKIGVKVEKFSLGFGPRIISKKKNDTQYCISAIPLGGYVKLAGDNPEEYKGNSFEFLAQAPIKRFWIIFFGPWLNYVLAFLCFWFIFFVGYPTLTTKVGSLIEGFGAKVAGIQPGDKIVAVDGKKVIFWDDLQNIIQLKKEPTTVMLTILRVGIPEFTTEVQIKSKEVNDILGKKRIIGLLGVTPSGEFIKVNNSFIKSFFLSANKTWSFTAMTYSALWMMFSGKLSMRESVTGPLGMFYITSKVASLGIIAVLHLIAVLSLSLAIFNLLPFPVLDGGHILFLIIEKIRGKALSIRAERIITRLGFTFLMTLALIVTYNDVVRFFGDKITKLLK